MGEISIAGIDKAELLAALFNGSHQQGMGFLSPEGRAPMSVSDAREIIDHVGLYFDYLRGRVLKVDLGQEPMRTGLYNRDCGPGAAERIIEKLRTA